MAQCVMTSGMGWRPQWSAGNWDTMEQQTEQAKIVSSISPGVNVCHNKLFSSLGPIPVRGGVYGRGSGSVLLDDLLCQGDEEDLLHCLTRPGSHTCDHSEDAGVRCEGVWTKIQLISMNILIYQAPMPES